MIMFWNQKEVFVGGYDKFNAVLDILAANKIKYKFKKVDTMWYVYVHRKDYDNACGLSGVARIR